MFLRARAQIGDHFWRNSFARGKPEISSTIFPIIPVTSYNKLAPRAVARVARPLDRP
jgi:hypothetical protein